MRSIFNNILELFFKKQKQEDNLEQLKQELPLQFLGCSMNMIKSEETSKLLGCKVSDIRSDLTNSIRYGYQFGTIAQEWYKKEYEVNIDISNLNPAEQIFSGFYITDFSKFKKNSPNIILPFGIMDGMSRIETIERIGIKPYLRSHLYLENGELGKFDWYDCDTFQTNTTFDEQDVLTEISFHLISKEVRSSLNFQKNIKKQKKNIHSEYSKRVASQIEDLPFLALKNIVDANFAQEVEETLIAFVKNCSKYTKSRNPKAIHNSVKKVVMKINDINSENNGLIETIEREAFCEFIEQTILLTGFVIDNGIDITEEWREW